MNPFFLLFESSQSEEIEEIMIRIFDKFMHIGIDAQETFDHERNLISDHIFENQRILNSLETFQKKVSDRFYQSLLQVIETYFVQEEEF